MGGAKNPTCVTSQIAKFYARHGRISLYHSGISCKAMQHGGHARAFLRFRSNAPCGMAAGDVLTALSPHQTPRGNMLSRSTCRNPGLCQPYPSGRYELCRFRLIALGQSPTWARQNRGERSRAPVRLWAAAVWSLACSAVSCTLGLSRCSV